MNLIMSSYEDTWDSVISEYSEGEQNAKRARNRSQETVFLRGINDIDFVDDQSIVQHYNGTTDAV